jgi:hypothetical protein
VNKFVRRNIKGKPELSLWRNTHSVSRAKRESVDRVSGAIETFEFELSLWRNTHSVLRARRDCVEHNKKIHV